ncbi:LytR/AlgR family response regulator transcription factor [Anaerotaenia torta]|uniref:LytR/AlgR family response regulator transcription factor n=1 Tax=Anaerotaenia torta TaxID=433293 RepID=UPI003D1C6CFF
MIIGICDDEPLVVKILTQLVNQTLDQKKVNVEVLPFLSGFCLLDRIEALDAVFLDIDMPGMDGFEVGRAINKEKPSCKIIMASGNPQRYKDSFKINAFRFITKPFDFAEIEEAIDSLLKVKAGEENFLLYLNYIPHDILQKNIKYFRAFNGYCEAKVQNLFFRRDLSLNEVEKLLDPRLFIRIHKQYIVNMQHINNYKNIIVEINGEFLPISRRKQKEFEQKYICFNVNYKG